MTRGSLLLIAVWGLLGVPVLCMGGLILHPCECGDDDGCAHECPCSLDPCSSTLAARKEVLSSAVKLAPPQPDGRYGSAGHAREVLHRPSRIPRREAPLDPRLPCHESDLPLLI